MTRPRLLLLDDDANFAKAIRRGLPERFDLHVATTAAAAREMFVERVDLAFVDVALDGRSNVNDRSGLDFLTWLQSEHPDLPVVILTGSGDDGVEIEALRRGAADFIRKERLRIDLLAANADALLDRTRLRTKTLALQDRLDRYEAMDLVGDSEPLRAVRALIEAYAATDSTVFVTGESGSGKEVVARCLHQAGPRREGPFVPVNCASLPNALIESQLFGHEKGAFTGADRSSPGLFEHAAGGTLFLDEVTELPLEFQAKLLRALQERCVRRVGGVVERPVDARVVAASNRDPEASVRDKAFREDLYYRLNVLRLPVPPLRERASDIPLLVQHLLERLGHRVPVPRRRFSNEAMARLQRYGWPGNVRELSNIVERAAIICREPEIPAELVMPWLQSPAGRAEAGQTLDFERRTARAQIEALAEALDRTHGAKEEARRLLGFADRSTMRRNAKRLREEHPDIWSSFPGLAIHYSDPSE